MVLGGYGCPVVSLDWPPFVVCRLCRSAGDPRHSKACNVVGLVSAMVQIMADWLRVQPARKGIATLWFIHLMRVRDSVRESM